MFYFHTLPKNFNIITMSLRWEFRLFWLDSRLIWVCFSHFRPVSIIGRYAPIWPIRLDSDRIRPVRRESKPIRRESSRVGANLRKKKKNSDSAPMHGQPRRMLHPASDLGAAPSLPRLCFLGIWISFFVESWQDYIIVLKKKKKIEGLKDWTYKYIAKKIKTKRWF